MTLITKGVAAIAALLATTVSATAGTPAAQANKAQVLVCERPTPASYVQHREYGRMTFASAQQLLADPSPAAKPRCITRAELARYQTLYAQRTQALASR